MISTISNYTKSRYRKDPYKITLRINNQCNSKCKHCQVWKNKKQNNLSIESLNSFFNKIKFNIIWITISGGEPFLRDDVNKFVELIRNNFKSIKVISIATNGSMQKRINDYAVKISKIKGVKFYITLSLDGPEKIHNKIRGVKNSYSSVLNLYRILKIKTKFNKNIKIKLETTISKLNIGYLYNFYLKLIKQGISKKDIVLTLYHNADVYNNQNLRLQLTKSDMKEFKRVVSIFNSTIIPTSFSSFINKEYINGYEDYLKNNLNTRCVALIDSFTIDANGDIYPCAMWNNKLGNIYDQDFDLNKEWSSKKFEKMRNQIKKRNCPICWTPCEAYQSIISKYFLF